MNKIAIAFILTACALDAAFAEGPFSVTVDAAADAFYMRSFSGDYATTKPELEYSPYKYQGEGDITSFQSSAFDDGLNGRVKFAYSGEKLGGLLELRANTDTEAFKNWEWEAWMRLGKWARVLAGNLGARGRVSQYQNFDDFLVTKVDYFGILIPEWQRNTPYTLGNNIDTIASFPWGYNGPDDNKGFAKFTPTDTSDIFMPAGSSARPPLNFLLDVNIEPVTVSASLGGLFSKHSRPFDNPWEATEGERLNQYDTEYDPLLYGGMNLGFRLESAPIAGIVSFAALYKYSDTLLEKPDSLFPINVLEETIKNHAFGVYANIAPLQGVGISLGYSGRLQIWKNPQYEKFDEASIKPGDAVNHFFSMFKEAAFPFYHGIDLRASFTGIKKLAITFNNNASFAQVKGNGGDWLSPARPEKYAASWVYVNRLNENVPEAKDRSENYFGLYNALGISFAFNNSLKADLQAANQLGIFTLDWEEESVKAVTNNLGLYAGVSYKVIEKEKTSASIRGGAAVKISSYSYDDPNTLKAPTPLKTTHKAGITDFGIPIGLLVEF